jgi:undecaprenyl-phosphate galactose phosphotransferase
MDGDVRSYTAKSKPQAPASNAVTGLTAPFAIGLVDVFALLLAFVAGRVFVRAMGRYMEPLSLDWSKSSASLTFLLVGSLLLASFAIRGHYNNRISYWEELRVICGSCLLYATFNLGLNFMVQANPSRLPVIGMWAMLMISIPLARILSHAWLQSVGLWTRGVLIIGDGEYAADAYRTLKSEPHLGLEPRAFMSSIAENPMATNISTSVGLEVFPLQQRPEELAARLGCATVVVALESVDSGFLTRLTSRLMRYGLEVMVIPPVKGLPVHGVEAQHFFNQDMLFLRVRSNLSGPLSRFAKRAFDILASSFFLFVLAPVFVYCAFRIWREDGAPVLYRQERVGRKSKPFVMLKFRSMVKDAEDVLTRWRFDNSNIYLDYVRNNFKLSEDPRVLKVGRWMRYTSFDELPQLWNVLRGDMSLIGPRPLLARELPDYSSEALYSYGQVRPGLSGVWQVSGRSGTTFKDRALMDMWYVRNWSLWVDIVVLLKTIRAVLHRTGAY